MFLTLSSILSLSLSVSDSLCLCLSVCLSLSLSLSLSEPPPPSPHSTLPQQCGVVNANSEVPKDWCRSEYSFACFTRCQELRLFELYIPGLGNLLFFPESFSSIKWAVS